jgi:hypothetical protein
VSPDIRMDEIVASVLGNNALPPILGYTPAIYVPIAIGLLAVLILFGAYFKWRVGGKAKLHCLALTV